jgi:hypothetical protein
MYLSQMWNMCPSPIIFGQMTATDLQGNVTKGEFWEIVGETNKAHLRRIRQGIAYGVITTVQRKKSGNSYYIIRKLRHQHWTEAVMDAIRHLHNQPCDYSWLIVDLLKHLVSPRFGTAEAKDEQINTTGAFTPSDIYVTGMSQFFEQYLPSNALYEKSKKESISPPIDNSRVKKMDSQSQKNGLSESNNLTLRVKKMDSPYKGSIKESIKASNEREREGRVEEQEEIQNLDAPPPTPETSSDRHLLPELPERDPTLGNRAVQVLEIITKFCKDENVRPRPSQWQLESARDTLLKKLVGQPIEPDEIAARIKEIVLEKAANTNNHWKAVMYSLQSYSTTGASKHWKDSTAPKHQLAAQIEGDDDLLAKLERSGK